MTPNAFFTRLARSPTALAFRPAEQPALARLLRRLAPLSARRVLEPGCGNGRLSRLLLHAIGPAGRLWAFDPCPAMIAQCPPPTPTSPPATFEIADVSSSRAPLAAWDLVLCFRLYPHLPNPTAFLARARQWLVPGGTLVIANLHDSASLNAIHAAKSTAVASHHMPTLQELRQTLAQAGWTPKTAAESPGDFFLSAQ